MTAQSLILNVLLNYRDEMSTAWLAEHTPYEVDTVQHALDSLTNAEKVYRAHGCYGLTEAGVQQARADIRNPYKSSRAWIANVRAGIDSQGRQTKVRDAAIPSSQSDPLSYQEPDSLEGILNMLSGVRDD